MNTLLKQTKTSKRSFLKILSVPNCSISSFNFSETLTSRSNRNSRNPVVANATVFATHTWLIHLLLFRKNTMVNKWTELETVLCSLVRYFNGSKINEMLNVVQEAIKIASYPASVRTLSFTFPITEHPQKGQRV